MKSCNQRLSRRRAFTLVELLVVIGIVALLISILLPALNKARGAANTVACAANLRSIGQGLVLYQQSNNGYYPMATGKTVSPAVNLCWPTTTSKFMGVKNPNLEAYDGTNNRSMPAFRCPSRVIEPSSAVNVPTFSTYSAHVLVFGNNYLGAQSWGTYNPSIYSKGLIPAGTTYVFAYKAVWMKNAAQKVIVFDGAQVLTPANANGFAQPAAMDMCLTTTNQAVWYLTSYAENRSCWNGTLTPGSPAMLPNANADDVGQDFRPGWPRFRHGGNDQGNFLFGDGHVETVRLNKKTYVMDLTISNFLVNFPLF